MRHLETGRVDISNKIPSHLFHLKADGRLDFVHFVQHVVRVGKQGGKLAGLAQARTQQPRDLLDQAVRCQESIVLLG